MPCKCQRQPRGKGEDTLGGGNNSNEFADFNTQKQFTKQSIYSNV
jgi:hypothetical protein